MLEEYGGHRRACGIKLRKDNFPEFFQSINRVAKGMLIPQDLIPTLEIDMQIPLSNLEENLIARLSTLSPFGADNPQPLLCSAGLKLRGKSTVISNKHIKFWVTDGRLTCEAIGYNKAGVFPVLEAGQTVLLAYSPSINNWQGNSSIQLKIEDLKITN